ncbi:methylenetetrahydrofolate reductase [Bacteroidota bacterium]
MRIIDIVKAKNGPTISFEMTRPKSEKGEANIGNVLDDLVALKPDFFTMTFGAGGGTREGSLQMLNRIYTERKQPVFAHLAGYGMSPAHLDETVDKFKEIGIENLLVIRGDKPQDENFVAQEGSFEHSSEMIKYLSSRHDMCFCSSAYPEAHQEAIDLDTDIGFLKEKIANGAEMIITQYFYDNQFFYDFIDKCKAAGITVPIIAGVMPIYSVKMMNILASLCGATITEEVKAGLRTINAEQAAEVNQWGIQFAIKQCADLIDNGVDGLHFYTLNRKSSVVGILEGLRSSGRLA